MSEYQTTSSNVEHWHHAHHLLSWKSIFAGLLIAIMTHIILSSLGVGVLGVAAQSAIEHERGGFLLASAMGIWMAVSAVVALFTGSYFAVRTSQSATNKMGAAHGFVVASAFFIILTVMASSAIGSLSMGLGHVVSGLGKGTASIAENSRVQDTINQTIGTTNLKSDPGVVAQGLGTRLLQGDTESAKAYFAYQTGLSQTEVSSKIDALNANFIRIAKEVGDKTAKAAAGTGLSLFVLFLVGVISAMMGGRSAAHSNLKQPFGTQEYERKSTYTGVFANQR